ncbi:putative type IX secretion system sortase PorU2 [Dyadobacter frigoris]|nr:C25 family cysteine peptidase [Dyadobacter frigoris]GLU55842.1 hypothetical protein Dfri01_53030 [Dyadobacter frigoris]
MSLTTVCFAQWNDNYGNEWIDYSKSYVRIAVSKSGIQKVALASLPGDFPKSDPTKLQLWHRGKEVPLMGASSTEIIFYGENNDGSSDSLVFRPSSARLNPYISLYSNEGSYFLTTSNSPKRVVTVDGSILSGVAEPFHIQKEVITFSDQFAFTSYGVDNLLNNSYYESSNSWTGATLMGANDTTGIHSLEKTFQLKNLFISPSFKPVLEVMVNGLNSGSHDVRISVGKSINDQDLTEIASIPFAGYAGKKVSVELNSNAMLSADGTGVMRVKSVSKSSLDWFGLTYYVLTYPQLVDMNGNLSSVFNFPASSNNLSRISIANVPTNSEIYNITDGYNPIRITGKRSGSALEVLVPRKSGQALKLFVISSDQIITVSSVDIHNVKLNPVFAYPSFQSGSELTRAGTYDYLMVTNDNLESASVQYSQYRSSTRGGDHKTFLVNIRTIYDEFNFGEPSPIAIRRFVNYMLKDGIRPTKHNLLLMGHSVSWPTRVVKEMQGEVPTFGDPGSDVLLVEGLQGSPREIAAIPVGRINAFTPAEVLTYLSKVDEYEHNTENGWKKNILHLTGGHSADEVVQLKNLLTPLVPLVENGVVGGEVRAFVRQNGSPDVEKVNITPDVNSGVGMITYFGHGSQTITDLDMGYASDATRNYQNTGKYPLMYFNGCGVGNIFVSRLTHTLSSDWMLAPNKGAIVIIANSYRSYISSSKRHLDAIYGQIFSENENRSIGQMLNKVAEKIMNSNPDSYDIANVHQSLIQGDPALILVRAAYPDYKVDPDESIFLYSESPDQNIGKSSKLKTGVIISNSGRYIKDQKIIIRLKYFFTDGSSEIKLENFTAMSSKDTLFLSYAKSKILSRIDVVIDPDKVLTESDNSNNHAQLDVDWGVAQEQTFYPTERLKDIIPPILQVSFNGRFIMNEEVVSPNPVIMLRLEDDRFISNDTTLMDIYIKPCFDDNCSYKKISYSGEVNLISISDKVLELQYYSTSLTSGDFQLLINVRDASGNTSVQPYSIRFKIAEITDSKVKVINSPNPATSYVKFQSSSLNPTVLASIQCTIYDLKGTIYDKIEIIPQAVTEWFWIPKSAVSGLYIYKVLFNHTDGSKEEVNGKIALMR